MLNSLKTRASQYVENLNDKVTDKTTEAYIKAVECAKNIEKIAADTNRLSPEDCEEKFNQLRIAFQESPEVFSQISGFGSEMHSSAGSMATGIVLIITGLFLTYMGCRILKAFLSISGFIIFGSITAILIIMSKPHLSFEVHYVAFWLIVIIGGVLGGFIFNKAWKFAIYCIASYGGVLAGFWILGMVPEINQYVNKMFFLIACSILSGICGYYMDEIIVIVSSSLVGSFTIFFGIDMIKPRGFRANLTAVFDEVKSLEKARDIAIGFMSSNVRNYMIGVLFVTVSGVYIQHRHLVRSKESE